MISNYQLLDASGTRYIKGRDLMLYFYINGAWKPTCHAQTCSLQTSAEFLEVTNADSGNFRDFLPTYNSWNISGDGLITYTDDINTVALHESQFNGTKVQLRWSAYGDQGVKYLGYGYIEKISEQANATGFASFSYTIRGVSQLTIQKDQLTRNLSLPADSSYPLPIYNVFGDNIGTATDQSDYIEKWNADEDNQKVGELSAGDDIKSFIITGDWDAPIYPPNSVCGTCSTSGGGGGGDDYIFNDPINYTVDTNAQSSYSNALLVNRKILVIVEHSVMLTGIDYTFDSGSGTINWTTNIQAADDDNPIRVEIYYF